MRLHFDNDWLRSGIARDPDNAFEEAGYPLEKPNMSYSFSVQGASKAEAKEKIAKEWDSIVSQQPIHKADRGGAQAAAEAFVDALSEHDDNQQINVSAYGSVSWSGDNVIAAVSGTVNVSLIAKV